MAFCPNCGTELREGMAFCPACGQPVPAAGAAGGGRQDGGYPPEPPVSGAADPAPTPAAPSRRKKLLPILLAAAAVLAVGLILFFTLGRGGEKDAGKSRGEEKIASEEADRKDGKKTADILNRRIAVRPYMEDDEAAYFPFSNGSCVELEENDGIKSACLTPDEKHIVVLTEDGDLYITDKSLKEKTRVAYYVLFFDSVTDKGFFYSTEDEEIYRYSFKSAESVKFLWDSEDIGASVFSDDGFGLLLVKDDELLLFPSAGKERKRIAEIDGNCMPLYLSDDGKTAVWAESSGYREFTFRIWNGKETKTLGRLEGWVPGLITSADLEVMVLLCADSGESLIWKKGKDPAKCRFPDGISSVWTAEASLNLSPTGGKELYIRSGDALYRVTMEGEKTKLVSGMEAFSISDGRLLWITEDRSLCCGKLGKDEIRNRETVDADVGDYWFSLNGRYVYYIKEAENGDCILYGYTPGEKEPVKIGGHADPVYTLYCSPSGDTVFYFTDVYGYHGYDLGELRTWTWNGENRMVDNDVSVWSLESGNRYGLIEPKKVWYLRDMDLSGCGDLCFWNGRNCTRLASWVTPLY